MGLAADMVAHSWFDRIVLRRQPNRCPGRGRLHSRVGCTELASSYSYLDFEAIKSPTQRTASIRHLTTEKSSSSARTPNEYRGHSCTPHRLMVTIYPARKKPK
ncbi:hypothetical protein GRAN_0094 [Granulicella sibirica]|uniref:Uncharacterized protein n=1 Tax=Granulicella sibirica TaxID=2479048 RepID=A0A4V1L5S5_9BACT|nr:hypothetical protein GRAN_0094 [Granulicella sibirica]